MRFAVLFPSDYFNSRTVDADYLPEYEAAASLPACSVYLLHYDSLVGDGVLRVHPHPPREPLCVYRGWMLRPQQYIQLYDGLRAMGAALVNTPEQYTACHLFPNAYPLVAKRTPKALWYPEESAVDWDAINRTFRRFMLKDYVKSVKGTDFPVYFETPVEPAAMQAQLRRFRELRGNLFTGGFLFKEYVSLRRYGAFTNEYRAFYLDGRLLTLSPNSGQPGHCPQPPESLVQSLADLPSRFYTADFAELENGNFILIETGDGQVSGLSPDQYIFKYYDEMRACLMQGHLKGE